MQLDAVVAKVLRHCAGAERTLVVGVSGGVDSMVLLHVLLGLRTQAKPPFQSLQVVHVHHGLRPGADTDAQFVRTYCRAQGVPCRIERVTVPLDTGVGVEAAARDARYAALTAVAARQSQAAIVLAHHADDQIETWLLRWLRGTSPSGLGSMRLQSLRQQIPVLRPLLTIPRQAIADYAQAHNIPHVEDETNADTRFSRNYLRHEVIPHLYHLQPELSAVTTTLTQQLQEDSDYLEMAAREFCQNVVRQRDQNVVCVDRSQFCHAHVSLQRRAIHILLNCFASKNWTHRHVEAILRLANDKHAPSASIQLGAGVCAWRSYDDLYIGYSQVRPMVEPLARTWHLNRDTSLSIEVDHAVWRFRRLPLPTDGDWSVRGGDGWRLYIPPMSSIEILIGASTSLRVRPLGLGGSKKLQDIFTDAKIPRMFRSKWPVFCVDQTIIWLPGLVRAADHTVQSHDKRGWIILAHLDVATRAKIGTLSSGARRMIRE